MKESKINYLSIFVQFQHYLQCTISDKIPISACALRWWHFIDGGTIGMEWEWLNALQSSEEFNSNLHLQIVPREWVRGEGCHISDTFQVSTIRGQFNHNWSPESVNKCGEGGRETSVKIKTWQGGSGQKILLFVYSVGVRLRCRYEKYILYKTSFVQLNSTCLLCLVLSAACSFHHCCCCCQLGSKPVFTHECLSKIGLVTLK